MSSIVIAGDTSGSVTLQAPAVAGSTVLNLPATSGTIQASGAGYTTNGVAYATSATGLVTGSALTFDGFSLGLKARTSALFYNTNSDNYARIQGATGSDNQLIFSLNSEVGRFTDTGFGVGTSSPSYKLQINGTSNTVGLGITGTHAANDNGIYYNLSAITGIYSTINAIVSATGSVNTTFGNGNTTSTGAHSRLDMYVGGSGGGDPKITYTVSGVLNWCIGVDNSDSDKFKISNSDSPGTNDYLTIDTSGNVGIGPIFPTERLDVGGFVKSQGLTISGANISSIAVSNANSYVWQVKNTNATPLSEYIQSLIFTASAPNNTSARFLEAIDTGGDRFVVRANGGIANYQANNVNLSDRREKTNFAPATSYLDKICAIPVQTFNYIDQNMEEDGGLTLGVVAQDVQAVAPELVMESNWAIRDEEPKMRLSIYQTDLQYALMKCIQEQQALITTLTERITALEGV
jgi:hypothetical protein